MGRPGLDPGTLGLKVQVKTLQSGVFLLHQVSKLLVRTRKNECARDSLERRETQCNEVVGTSALPVGGH